mmetsp:Transcript_37230/g.51413  ORF Transcript_37230/g.51413 Transcript_37230/m.51413 type:complete len:173 (-) Transcript_37230:82-600(-)
MDLLAETFGLKPEEQENFKVEERETGNLKVRWKGWNNLYFSPVFSTEKRGGGEFFSFTLSGNPRVVIGATPAHHLLDYECLMSHTTVAVRAESLFGARRDIPFFNTKDKTRIQIYVDFLAQEIQFTVEEEKIAALSYQTLNWNEGFKVGICGHRGSVIEVEQQRINLKPAKR